MKKLQIEQMEMVNGGASEKKASGWDYYSISCGVSLSILNASFLAGPVVFGANAIYLATCGLLIPIAKASGY